jgi:hypothetical protein
MIDPPERDPFVELGPPLSTVAWSSEFVIQSIEPLFVHLADGQARYLKPEHADSLQLGLSPESQPGQLVVDAAASYGLVPLLVHSTSWRYQEARIVMTYVAVVQTPDGLSHFLVDEPVRQTELARGDAFGPPPTIDVAQVLEHAFRHLAWLVKDDEQVRATLPDWIAYLDRYEPEPFRAFAAPPP